mmetsp:Transcript_6918/g.7650  ORF Transcript_6918/g.7650 Transcript_6918/m.7650 type:complete len:228 (+) Transcript_6918:162-845(+)
MGTMCSTNGDYNTNERRHLFEKFSQRSGGLTVRIFEGKLKDSRTTVIVNDANPKLTNQGQLSFDLMNAAGLNVQRECNQYISQNQALGVSEVAITDSGALGCSKIFHTVGPQWMGGDRKEEAKIEEAVIACLEAATKISAKSIAFPPLIREPYNIPLFYVSRSMLNAILNYSRRSSTSKSSLKEIHLIASSSTVSKLLVHDASEIFGLNVSENYSTSTSETIIGPKA